MTLYKDFTYLIKKKRKFHRIHFTSSIKRKRSNLREHLCYYFGGARSKGFATLRNVSKLQFFDKIGQAKFVGFRVYSAI